MIDADSLKLLNHLGLPPFQPFRLLRGGKRQTIAGAYWPQRREVSQTKFWTFTLSDGDQLVIAENTPPEWSEGDRIICLVHGLTGSHLSNYMVRMAHAFCERGAKVLRINLRSCGPGMGMAIKPYHCGISEDTRQLIQWLFHLYPSSPVTQIGFSLGGNLTLKMAGEQANENIGGLDSVIAVSPPLNLTLSSKQLARPENSFFDWYFTRRVINDVRQMESIHPEATTTDFPPKLRLASFDHFYTAPRSGFKSGEDYYIKASAMPLLASIRIPCLIIGSKDDPVVSGACFEKIPSNSWIEKVISDRGGHLGFLSADTVENSRWADAVLLKWADKNLSSMRQAPL